jgi:hypothetical protein
MIGFDVLIVNGDFDMETREQYLIRCAERINQDVFIPLGKGIPNYRVSVGFPGGGSARTRIGECWSPKASGDNTVEMFISPKILNDPILMLATLVHEMVHAIVGTKCGHKGPFRKLAISAGLKGKMTATEAGEKLTSTLQVILSNMGAFPGAELSLQDRKKQTTRMIKLACPDCDNIARQSRSAFQEYGVICGQCEVRMESV